jgi:cysteinyl-tRNA synthetase
MFGNVGKIPWKFFDIHCGGEDHISVHHTNEIAQTEACYGTRLANFWMHGYFLQAGDEKMSNPQDNFYAARFNRKWI